MSKLISIEVDFPDDFAKSVQRLADDIQHKAIDQAVNAAANVTVSELKSTAPEPGYKGDKPGLKPLRDTIGKVVRKTEHGAAAYCGPFYPAGAHAHLVEYGHEMVVSRGRRKGEKVGQVAANPFIRRAAEATQGRQVDAMKRVIKRHAEASK